MPNANRNRWEEDGARATALARNPRQFIAQHIASFLYRRTKPTQGRDERFGTEEAFWTKSNELHLASVCLENFRISDWFPRTPGVYWSRHGISARTNTWANEPKHDPELGRIFNPKSKMSLIEEGGIGTIRLRPRRIDNTDCWLATAVTSSQCAGGIPLAIPNSFIQEAMISWGETATIYGTVRFLQDAGLEDTAAYVHHASPIIIFVDEIERLPKRKQSTMPIIITPVALFDEQKSDTSHEMHSRRRENCGYTFVQCAAGSNEELEGAAGWIEKYASKHGGRVVTNFDERSPLLSDAPLSYQRLINKTYDRTIIEHLHFNGTRLADRIDHVEEIVSEYKNYGQVGAMGNNARSDQNTFMQQGSTEPIDLAEFARQLAQVRTEMKSRAKLDDAEQDAEIGAIAQAERAAKSGDQSKSLEFLKGAGKWTLEVAKSVAAGLVKDAIEGKIGS
jgi:hypothetical protein